MPADLLLSGGSILGIAGLTFATFAVVSFTEMRRKIDEQVSSGQSPYQLRRGIEDSDLSGDTQDSKQQRRQKKQASKKKKKKSK